MTFTGSQVILMIDSPSLHTYTHSLVVPAHHACGVHAYMECEGAAAMPVFLNSLGRWVAGLVREWQALLAGRKLVPIRVVASNSRRRRR